MRVSVQWQVVFEGSEANGGPIERIHEHSYGSQLAVCWARHINWVDKFYVRLGNILIHIYIFIQLGVSPSPYVYGEMTIIYSAYFTHGNIDTCI